MPSQITFPNTNIDVNAEISMDKNVDDIPAPEKSKFPWWILLLIAAGIYIEQKG